MAAAFTDIHALDADEWPIAEELENWARWVAPRSSRRTSPMFRLWRRSGRSKADYCFTPLPSVRIMDAQRTEAAVASLHRSAPLHATALRWYYVHEAPRPWAFRRRCGCDIGGLLRDARRRLAQIHG